MAVIIELIAQNVGNNAYTGILILVCAITLLKAYGALSSGSQAPASKFAEPPSVPSLIPGVGHVVGLMRHGSEYFTRVRKHSKHLPIMTLKTLGTSMYLVTSPDAVQAAYRNQDLDLLTLSLMFLHRVGGSSAVFAQRMLTEAKVAGGGGDNYWHEMNKVVQQQLASGPGLIQMNTRVLDSFAGVLNGINDGQETRIDDFYTWIWRRLVAAKTDALYGDRNPFKDARIMDHYWNFEKEHLDLMFRPLPSLLARGAFNGRAAVLAAFVDFSRHYSTGGRSMGPDVSRLIQARTVINEKYDLDLDSCAATELSLLYGSTANAIPTLYWMLTYISHDARLLAALRDEVRAVVVDEEAEEAPSRRRRRVVDTTRIAASCPLLVSTYQETLRMVSRHPGARIVEQDTVLTFPLPNDHGHASYALKKGSVVQMPAGLLHRSEEHWGPTADVFDGYRFLDLAGDKARERRQKKAYIPLGGGKHLCPGRHFSFTEILGIVTAVITGFDVAPSSASVPEQKHQLGLGIVKPHVKCDLAISIRPRQRSEGVSWAFRT